MEIKDIYMSKKPLFSDDEKTIGETLKVATRVGVDLRDADLRDADLSGVDLRDADLRDADLRVVNITGADLTGAKYNEA